MLRVAGFVSISAYNRVVSLQLLCHPYHITYNITYNLRCCASELEIIGCVFSRQSTPSHFLVIMLNVIPHTLNLKRGCPIPTCYEVFKNCRLTWLGSLTLQWFIHSIQPLLLYSSWLFWSKWLSNQSKVLENKNCGKSKVLQLKPLRKKKIAFTKTWGICKIRIVIWYSILQFQTSSMSAIFFFRHRGPSLLKFSATKAEKIPLYRTCTLL